MLTHQLSMQTDIGAHQSKSCSGKSSKTLHFLISIIMQLMINKQSFTFEICTYNIATSYLSFNTGSHYWIGGNDLETEGNWVWISHGCPFKFNDWKINQPDNYKGIEHFAMMLRVYAFQWNDINSKQLAFYICEK
jgi:hypothetical protein